MLGADLVPSKGDACTIKTPEELRAEIEREWVKLLIAENEGLEERAEEVRENLRELLAYAREFGIEGARLVQHVSKRLNVEGFLKEDIENE